MPSSRGPAGRSVRSSVWLVVAVVTAMTAASAMGGSVLAGISLARTVGLESLEARSPGLTGPSAAPPATRENAPVAGSIAPSGAADGSVGEAGSLVATVTVGDEPFGLAYDSDTGTVYVADSGADSISVISAATEAVIGSPISETAGPLGLTYDSGNGDVYAANEVSGSVSVISGATNTVVGSAITVGNGPSGIAYDSANGDLYVTNYDADTVSVIDGATNTVVGSAITVGSVPFHDAYDSATGDIYVTNAVGDSVSVIDGTTNTVVGSAIAVGSAPEGVTYDSETGDVYVANVGSDSVSVINGATNAVIGSPISVGSEPYNLVYGSGSGDVYVADYGSASVGVISTVLALGALAPYLRGVAVTSATPGAPPGFSIGVEPVAVAYDSANGEVFVADTYSSEVTVIDGVTNTVIGSPIPVGSEPFGLAYDSANGDVYVACDGSDSVTVISGATNTVVATAISVGEGPYAVAYDSGNGDVYVANLDADTVSVISGATNTVVGSAIPVGVAPAGLAYDSQNGNVYVVNYDAGTVSVIDGATNAVIGSAIPVGTDPLGAAYDSGNGDVYVSNLGSDTVSVISGATNTVIGSAIPVESEPYGVAYDSGTGNVYVANLGTDVVSVISGATNTVSAEVTVGASPIRLAYDSGNGIVYVADAGTYSMSEISSLAATTTPSGPELDVGQTLLLAAPLTGEGTGELVWTADSGNQTGLNCSADPTGGPEISVVCLGAAPGTYEVTLSVTDTDGNTVVSTLTVTVEPDATLFSITATPTSVDVGESLLLSTGGVEGGSAPYSYNWSGLPLGCTSENAPSLICTPEAAGVFEVAVTVVDAYGFAVAPAPVLLAVYDAPTVGLLVASPTSIDVGQSTTITGSVTGPGSGGVTDVWTVLQAGAGCTTVNATTFSCAPSTAGSYTVTMSATDSNGVTAVSTPLVFVADPSLGPVTVAASASTVVVGQLEIFTASVSGGSGEYTYAWSDLPTGCVSADAAVVACTPTSASATTYGVSVRVTDSNGATKTATVSTPVSVTAAAVPSTSISGPEWAALGLAIAALAVGAVALLGSRRKGGSPPPSGASGSSGSASTAGPTSGR